LERDEFVVTTEIQVPSDATPEDLVFGLGRVQGRVDGVAVTDERPEQPVEAVVADTLRTCAVLRSHALDPVFRVATRRADRLQIQQRLLDAGASGVEELLAFTVDYRLTGDSLQEMMFFHVDVEKLFSVVGALEAGRDIGGTDLSSPLRFSVGAGVDASVGERLPPLQEQELSHMASHGIAYFLTTPVFDLEAFAGFMKRVAPLGVPVIAEVMILRSAGMAHHLNRYFRPGLVPASLIDRIARSKDRELTSVEIFAELLTGLREQCRGVHVVPVGAERTLYKYLEAARIF
jgi:5,10-methylenetetrahydrofolate reductase